MVKKYPFFIIFCVGLLSACGGGGGGGVGSDNKGGGQLIIVDNNVLPQVSFEKPIITVSESSVVTSAKIILDKPSEQAISVTIIVAGSATEGQDFATINTNVVNFPAGVKTQFFDIQLLDDKISEDQEHVLLTLNHPDASLATRGAIDTFSLIIKDNDPRLNDTAIKFCVDSSNQLVCPQELFPGQDGDLGRDVDITTSKIGAGDAAFDFTKLDGNGIALVDQNVAYADSPWPCVKDNVTKRVWEVKTDVPLDLRFHTATYTWFNSNGAENQGQSGVQSGNGVCDVLTDCNTEFYVAAVNNLNSGVGLCGFNDWRLPEVAEWVGLANFSGGRGVLDTVYFPNARLTAKVWTQNSYANTSEPLVGHFGAWWFDLATKKAGFGNKNLNIDVRLVRSD